MTYYGPAYSGQLGGLKKVLRKIAGPVAAGAAIAAGQPELAVAAYNTAGAVTKKKPKAPALVEPPAPPVSAGSLFSNLAPADRNVLLIGGTLVGTLLLAGVLGGRRR